MSSDVIFVILMIVQAISLGYKIKNFKRTQHTKAKKVYDILNTCYLAFFFLFCLLHSKEVEYGIISMTSLGVLSVIIYIFVKPDADTYQVKTVDPQSIRSMNVDGSSSPDG